MNANIRELQASDLPAAMVLWAATDGVGLTADETLAMLTGYLNRNPGISTAAVSDDGSLVGAVLGGHDGRRAFLYHLAVSKERRGEGIGASLVARTMHELGAQGLKKATIMVYADNAQGRAFWEHLGWKVRVDLQPMQLSP